MSETLFQSATDAAGRLRRKEISSSRRVPVSRELHRGLSSRQPALRKAHDLDPVGERPYDSQPFWISHASLSGLPAVVAPVGRTTGNLPVGAKVIGPLYEDDSAITFVELLSEVIGGYDPPPSIEDRR